MQMKAVAASHLSWGPVQQPTYVHPHVQGLARRCFYHLRQSSRVLQQCVISDQLHRHKDPPVSFALSCTTHHAYSIE